MLKIFSRAYGLWTLLFATFGGPEPLVKILPGGGDRAFNQVIEDFHLNRPREDHPDSRDYCLLLL